MTTNEIARQIVETVQGDMEFYGPLHRAITTALDQERRRGEKFRSALEFYADVNNWRGLPENRKEVRVICEPLEHIWDEMVGGRFAREALKEDSMLTKTVPNVINGLS